jgi:hypothetical protein
MGATTKGQIVIEVKRFLKAGNPGIATNVQNGEIAKLIEQEAMLLLKGQRFNEYLPEGDMYPDGSMLAEYDSVPVVAYKNVSKAVLPANPIGLPMGMGVWHVSKVDSIHDPFVPMLAGQFGLARNIRLLGDVSGIIAYEKINRNLIFNKNLVASGITQVYMQLVVTDIFNLGDWDILPITADMESTIVKNVVTFLLGRPPADRVVDSNDKA